MIKFDADICSRFESASTHEWLETNGIGGYASSTVSGAHTRRYHALLVAALRPPLGRMVLLSKFEETVIIDGERFELSCSQYPGAIYPKGYQYLTGFRLDPFPVWTYEVNGVVLERSVFMPHNDNAVVCRWTVISRTGMLSCKLELLPLVAFRDHHHLRRKDPLFSTEFKVEQGLVSLEASDGLPTLYFSHSGCMVEATGNWYHNFEYAIELERGFDYHEDLFQPCRFTFDLSTEAMVIASTSVHEAADAPALASAEIDRRNALADTAGARDDVTRSLVLAADQFIVARGDGETVIAGYHWFSDWGRDTMIALRGLTLASNHPETARRILLEFSRHISEGMLPNRFPDAGETPDYNTVDATLWFFEAIRAYAEKTGDHSLIRAELYEKLVNIIEWHVRGTRFNIHVDTDGLLYAGGAGSQLTWMDAKVGDWVVTPRTGKPVEIQALWYNALFVMADFATRFDDLANQKTYMVMAAAAKASFNGQFWNAAADCLFDVVNAGGKDASVRPNQIFAVSLPHSMLDADKAAAVVAKVQAELLTPYGLRSLSPSDPNYCPTYIGTPLERDGAYHQGTVWAWLIGPFIDAYLTVHGNGAEACSRAANMIRKLEEHLSMTMAGQASEIFDGDSPHAARGCAAQAWSVAELLRTKQRLKNISER